MLSYSEQLYIRFIIEIWIFRNNFFCRHEILNLEN